MKRNQMCPKTSEIRAQADVINLLVSGKRSGWTHNCWSTIGWLIINCGWNRSVPVLTTQGWHIHMDFISNSIPPYSPILLWCFDINCRTLKHKIKLRNLTVLEKKWNKKLATGEITSFWRILLLQWRGGSWSVDCVVAHRGLTPKSKNVVWKYQTGHTFTRTCGCVLICLFPAKRPHSCSEAIRVLLPCLFLGYL